MLETEAQVNLTLTGENKLKSGREKAGLQVPYGASLTIKGEGSLTATGGYGGAGIGGSGDTCGSITITSGTVTAFGGLDGAGIGGRSGTPRRPRHPRHLLHRHRKHAWQCLSYDKLDCR